MLALGNLLLIDDDPLVQEAILAALQGIPPIGSQVFTLNHPKAVGPFLEANSISLILTDIHMGEENGLDSVSEWKAKSNAVVLVISGDNRPSQVNRAFAMGADGFLPKPFHPPQLRAWMEKHFSVAAQNPRPGSEDTPWLVGRSPAIARLKQQISRLKGKPGLNILIQGESGTGKERVARALHGQEASSQRPWVVANMAAIPPTLMESELFGVEKGAFTDAKQSRAGKFELAHRGDLFLDEIGDLPYEAQAKILRIIQEKHVERLGANQGKDVEVRLISASHRNLEEEIEQNKFRSDLYFRLAEVVLTVPPLRERKEDVPALVADFLSINPLGEGRSFSAKAIDELVQYHWPGNVRELESTLKRSLAFTSPSEVTTIEWTPHQKTWNAHSENNFIQSQMRTVEHDLVWKAWKKNGGQVEKASQDIGISKATFYRRLKEIKANLPSES